ncbi:MAG: P1 family peptidase [Candidatus Heimdallarchaeota archaeon]|nr:P1 family peptidase [Candidatus Heimdallarchaeota archaeon]MCK4877343.1 P1 family peptidase [Candidatus Heimdallarchaeota archaeon]
MKDYLSNDKMALKPKTDYRKPFLEFDFHGVEVGIGEYEEGPTGCTVIQILKDNMMYVDVRGGAVGVIGQHWGFTNAVCLSGGSLYGFEAISGVTAELLKQNSYSPDWEKIPIVNGAIIFDVGFRGNTIYPDKELGRAAVSTVREGILPIGNQGAGKSATVGKTLDYNSAQLGGQGGAFKQIGDTKILVCTVVNSVGAILNKKGEIVRGFWDNSKKQRINLLNEISKKFEIKNNNKEQKTTTKNTTLTVVITNQKMDRYGLTQMGRQVHTSMARAINPFHTITDGDVLFMISTNEVENKKLDLTSLGAVASEVAWNAVLSCYEENQKGQIYKAID